MKIMKSMLAASLFAMPMMAQAADTFNIDPQHTMVTFELNHLGFSKSIGWFETVSGTISYDAGDVTASSVSAVLTTSSINTNLEGRDGWIKSDKVLNAAAHPSITFTSTGIEQSSDTTGVITGDLTMNGQTVPVSLDATFNALGPNPLTKKETLGVSATATLNRSEWGVGAFVGPLGDELKIQIELEAIKADG